MTVQPLTTDVLIVGGGPAGTSAALSLLNYSNATVMLVEQSDFNNTRVGEHVSSSLFDILKYLKIDKDDFESGSFMPSYGNTSYWGSNQPTSTESIFTVETSTFQLDRDKFDFKLVEQVAERGGIVFPRTKCLNYLLLQNNEWEIILKHPEKGIFTVFAKYLIDATGRQASVCRQIGVPSKKIDSLMGIGAFFKLKEGYKLNHNQVLETNEFGWWYNAVLPDKTVVTTLFSDADIIAQHKLNQNDTWYDLLQSTNLIKHKLKDTVSLSKKVWVRNACTQISDSSFKDSFIAIGDAASSFDPISSMGIGFAMSSACNAARIIKYQLIKKDPERVISYQKDISNNFDNYLKIRKQFYQQEKRWPSSVFWKRRN